MLKGQKKQKHGINCVLESSFPSVKFTKKNKAFNKVKITLRNVAKLFILYCE